MKLLAIETGTQTLSVALAHAGGGAPQLWQTSGAGGAQASTTLIGIVLDLLRQADLRLSQLDALCFGAGPGSFTGLRTACAVAQGLAFGAGIPVLPVDSLLALAEEARARALPGQPQCEVTALLDARMNEIYAARYAYSHGHWTTLQAATLLAVPALGQTDWAQQAPAAGTSWLLAGNVFAEYAEQLALDAATPRLAALPTASAMLRLAPQLLQAGLGLPAAQALPRYIRDKVAQTSAERSAQKAAARAAAAPAARS
ncbi:MAG: tRNA (adenosine(37)-N6)-threonylcarbamoyltransferase complex dimerization subunit type 1 TsaB [Rhodoferax sp.]